MFLLGNTRREGTYIRVAFLQIEIFTREPSLLNTEILCLSLKDIT
jgi:hypothetical protein